MIGHLEKVGLSMNLENIVGEANIS